MEALKALLDPAHADLLLMGVLLVLGLAAFLVSLFIPEHSGLEDAVDWLPREPKAFTGSPAKRRTNVVDLADAKERQRLAAIVQERRGA